MKWFEKLKAWIRKTFNKVNEQLKIIIPIGIEIVENMKKFVDSPTADVLTSIIPGTVDDQIADLLRKVLPKILLKLRDWKELQDITDEQERLRQIIIEIGTGAKGILSKVERDAFKLEIASQTNAELAGISAAQSKIATLTAYHYPEIFTENETA